MLHLTLLMLSNPISKCPKVSEAPPPHSMPMYSFPLFPLVSSVLPHNLRSRVTLVSALLRCARVSRASLETFLDGTHESACPLCARKAKASIIAFRDTSTRSEINTTCLNACIRCRAKASIIACRGTCSGSRGNSCFIPLLPWLLHPGVAYDLANLRLLDLSWEQGAGS